MADAPALSFSCPNYSGLLFNKGNTRTPFSTLIGGRPLQTNSVEFVCGQEYTSAGGSQPAISEEASLTAPYSTLVTRTQLTNVTQIFQETFNASYAKLSNMGSLSGANIAGQVANPINELDFQAARKMEKIARDIEFTFIQGAYAKAANDQTANKTRGISTAISTNVVSLSGTGLRVWDVADAMKLIYDSNGSLNGLVAMVDAVTLFQLNADAEINGLTVVPAARNINGLAITTILTPLGEIGLMLGEFVPSGTALIVNPMVCAPVFQPVPGKGNFFSEPLDKVGAGIKYQIFGQIGLDSGPEWMHAKITGIATTFTKPTQGKKVYISADTVVPTTIEYPVLNGATLSGTYKEGVATTALSLTYTGSLAAGTPTLAYQWEIASTVNGTYSNISGATNATYTPATADVGKFIRCKVTASVLGTGTVYTNKSTAIAAA